MKEYTEKEALARGQNVKDKAATLVKKYGKGAVKHADDLAVKSEVRNQLKKLIPMKHR